MPKISVIIVNFNAGADRLRKSVDSVLAQTEGDFELILWDNASADGSLEGLPKDPKIKLHENSENLGFAGGVNAAVKRATGEWIALLNPDAVAVKDWLETFIKGQIAHPTINIFGCVQRQSGDESVLDGLGDAYHSLGIAWRCGYGHPVYSQPERDQEIFSPSGTAAFFRRKTFLDIGGFAEEFFCYHEDVDLGARLRLTGEHAILLSGCEIVHEGSATTIRYSDFSVFHGIRNRFWTFVRVMPGLLFWLGLPAHMVIQLLFAIRAAMMGHGRAYFHGLWAGLRGFHKIFAQRGAIQSRRNVSQWTFAKMLCWSPIKMIKRDVFYLKSSKRPHKRSD